MGNHSAGRAVVDTAKALADVRGKTGQTAMEILDIACKPYSAPPMGERQGGCDIEFDDEVCPDEPFGKLIIEAFGLSYDYGSEDDEINWYDEVYKPFKTRYGFC